MKLVVERTDLQDAVIPVSWCLQRKELEELETRRVEKPQVLIVTVHEKKEVDRYLVPVKQMLLYVQFHKPGENTILAMVVWHSEGKTFKLWERFFKKGTYGGHGLGKYSSRVVTNDGNIFIDFDCPQLKEEAKIIVTVPAEFFAKEPPAWERRWVNLWFETQPMDQCHFRRRRFVAYSIQPIILLLWITFITLFRILAVGVLRFFLGMQGVNTKCILHPLRHETADIWRDVRKGDSVFLRNAEGKKTNWVIRLFSPPVFVTILAIAIGLSFLFPSLSPTVPWWYYPIVTLVFMAVFVLVGLVFLAIGYLGYALLRFILKPFGILISKPWTEWKNSKTRAKEERDAEKRLQKEEERKRRRERSQAELEKMLVCDGPFEPRLAALPKEKQTIHLKLQYLKAQVCKPYAR